MDTLAERDRKILKFVSDKNIVGQSDLASFFGVSDSEGITNHMRTIIDGKYVSIIRPLGQTSFTLTQKGIRALK